MNKQNAALLNQCLESMIPYICENVYANHNDVDIDWNGVEIIDDADDATGFFNDFAIISKTFECNCKNNCQNIITKSDILMQLVLIDSLYSTNIKRMRAFGLEEICDDIYKLCDSGKGVHTLRTLTSKINATRDLSTNIASLFTKQYGYIKGGKAGSAPSLLSKYMFFATVACPADTWGFPIYDSIANSLLRKVQKFLDIPVTPQMLQGFDINIYIEGLKSIIDALTINKPDLWNRLSILKYQLLDYFLWNIGKTGLKSYSLLLTKNELLSCYQNGSIVKLPRRIAYWQSIYEKLK